MMTLRNFSLIPSLTDTLFSDRFNRMDRLFSQLTGDTPVTATPAYDIRRVDKDRYVLAISVPGWKEKELSIETVGGQLTVSGKKEQQSETENQENGWLHRGISRADFRLSYTVPEQVKVTGAKLEDGILSVDLYQEIPESEKPRRIPISHGQKAIENQQAIEHQSA